MAWPCAVLLTDERFRGSPPRFWGISAQSLHWPLKGNLGISPNSSCSFTLGECGWKVTLLQHPLPWWGVLPTLLSLNKTGTPQTAPLKPTFPLSQHWDSVSLASMNSFWGWPGGLLWPQGRSMPELPSCACACVLPDPLAPTGAQLEPQRQSRVDQAQQNHRCWPGRKPRQPSVDSVIESPMGVMQDRDPWPCRLSRCLFSLPVPPPSSNLISGPTKTCPCSLGIHSLCCCLPGLTMPWGEEMQDMGVFCPDRQTELTHCPMPFRTSMWLCV